MEVLHKSEKKGKMQTNFITPNCKEIFAENETVSIKNLAIAHSKKAQVHAPRTLFLTISSAEKNNDNAESLGKSAVQDITYKVG